MSTPAPHLVDQSPLPAVLVGPLLRRLEPTRLVLWLVGSRELALTLRLAGVGDIGWYGKVASLGDFTLRGLPPEFVQPWDTWLQQGMRDSRTRLGHMHLHILERQV